jgi:1-acyl-sn-glycerol-3-phosphate acyltransferase
VFVVWSYTGFYIFALNHKGGVFLIEANHLSYYDSFVKSSLIPKA